MLFHKWNSPTTTMMMMNAAGQNMFIQTKAAECTEERKRGKFAPSFPECCPQVVIEMMMMMMMS